MTDGHVFGRGYSVGVNDACMIDDWGGKILCSAVRELTLWIEGLISCLIQAANLMTDLFLHIFDCLAG